MASTKVRQLIGIVENLLLDPNATRWPRLKKQEWINEAYAVISLLKPDANTNTADFTCVAGSVQSLTAEFPEATRLTNVLFNAEGSKRAVTRISRLIVDNQNPVWRSMTGSADIMHFIVDDDTPVEFEVYPPATIAAKLKVVYTSVPTPHEMSEADLAPDSASTDTINIDDSYRTILVDYIMYRALSIYTGDDGSARSRADSHLSAMAQALGASIESIARVSPQQQHEQTL